MQLAMDKPNPAPGINDAISNTSQTKFKVHWITSLAQHAGFWVPDPPEPPPDPPEPPPDPPEPPPDPPEPPPDPPEPPPDPPEPPPDQPEPPPDPPGLLGLLGLL